MISDFLSSIEGVAVYPIITLVLFFAIFSGLVVWVLKMSKSYTTEMENLPLDNNENNFGNSDEKK